MLVCWRPTDLPFPDFYDPELFAEYGITEEIDEEKVGEFNAQWDRRDDFEPDIDEEGNDRNDCGWIGEDEQGVWVRLNPLAALTQDELLWDLWTEWRFGLRDLVREDFDRLSNFEIEAWAAMRSADAREQLREVKRNRDGGGEE